MKRIWIAVLCCASLQAWPVPEKVVVANHIYALLRYELTPTQVEGYGSPKRQWWGALREVDGNAPAQCDGFSNNGPVCAPFVHNIIGAPIPRRLAKAPAREAAVYLLSVLRSVMSKGIHAAQQNELRPATGQGSK